MNAPSSPELAELSTRSDREYVPSLTLAFVAMALGDANRACEWLEQEYRDRGILLWAANGAVWFDPLRSDRRFQVFLRKMNSPENPSPDVSSGA